MSSTTTPTPPPTQPEAVQIPIEHRRKARTLPVTIGAVLATVGTFVAIAGGGVLAAAGDDGTIGSGTGHEISTTTAALVSDTAEIDATSEIATAIGNPRIGIEATAQDGGPDKFVGIAKAADIDRYLAGVEVDRVTDFEVEPFRLTKERRPGIATATRPGAQTFWVAQSSGRVADVDWKVKDGDYKLVVMNADGSAGMTADSHYEVGLPYLSTYALGLLLTGVLALAAGIILIARNSSLQGPATRGTVEHS